MQTTYTYFSQSFHNLIPFVVKKLACNNLETYPSICLHFIHCLIKTIVFHKCSHDVRTIEYTCLQLFTTNILKLGANVSKQCPFLSKASTNCFKRQS